MALRRPKFPPVDIQRNIKSLWITYQNVVLRYLYEKIWFCGRERVAPGRRVSSQICGVVRIKTVGKFRETFLCVGENFSVITWSIFILVEEDSPRFSRAFGLSFYFLRSWFSSFIFPLFFCDFILFIYYFFCVEWGLFFLISSLSWGFIWLFLTDINYYLGLEISLIFKKVIVIVIPLIVLLKVEI